MNPIITKLQKTSNYIIIIVRVVQILLLVLTTHSLIQTISITNRGMHEISNWMAVTIQSVFTCIMIVIALFISTSVLKSVKLDNTPFTHTNVKRLKIIAFLVIITEIISSAISFFSSFFSQVIQGDVKIVLQSYMGGTLIAMGLIIFCVAVAFEYGTTLQKQSDETL